MNSTAEAQQNMILDLLRFNSLHERFDSITEAEEKTFSWLLDYENQSLNNQPNLVQARDDLVKWLKQGDKFFYISGKPGAGKSTLVKFISTHATFLELAAQWAEDSTPLIGRFFFWKPGQADQKSIDGLLRGLLYSLLQKAPPPLAAVAFPKHCLSEFAGMERVEIEHDEVLVAFNNILSHCAATQAYKIILSIDGLDEFDGDHVELLQLMESWVTKYQSQIKICVSSREYGVFEDFFATSPKFRLHELTRNDMSCLITSRLKPNRFFSSLLEEDAVSIKELIATRAEGVFLWVVMVVASIDDGLLSGSITNARELERSIEACPSELDDLLPHLLSSVSVHNRVWAFKAISLVQFTQFEILEMLNSGQNSPGVGLMDLMLLDEASTNWNLSAFQPRSENSTTDITTRLQNARLKVPSRSKGFLNVVSISEANCWPANGDQRLYVSVTHRSVVEYLSSDAARGSMAQYLTNFDPFFALFSTMLACLRFLEPSNYPLLKEPDNLPKQEHLQLMDVLSDSLKGRWEDFILYAKLSGQSASSRFLGLLDSVGDSIKRHLTIQMMLRKIRLSDTDNTPHDVLVTLCLKHGVKEYSEWRSRNTVSSSTVPSIVPPRTMPRTMPGVRTRTRRQKLEIFP